MFQETPTLMAVREGSGTDRAADMHPFDAWIREASSTYDQWLSRTYRDVEDGE